MVRWLDGVLGTSSNVWGQGASRPNGPFLVGYDRTVDRSRNSNMKFLFFFICAAPSVLLRPQSCGRAPVFDEKCGGGDRSEIK